MTGWKGCLMSMPTSWLHWKNNLKLNISKTKELILSLVLCNCLQTVHLQSNHSAGLPHQLVELVQLPSLNAASPSAPQQKTGRPPSTGRTSSAACCTYWRTGNSGGSTVGSVPHGCTFSQRVILPRCKTEQFKCSLKCSSVLAATLELE